MHSWQAIGIGVTCSCWSAILLLTGCDSRPAVYPVRGTVKFASGEPLAGGSVELRSVTSDLALQRNARGEIGPDGSFTLTTFQPGDGAVAGEHEACVFAPVSEVLGSLNSEPPPNPLDRKFQAYETAGLKFTVTKEGPNEFHINVGAKKTSR